MAETMTPPPTARPDAAPAATPAMVAHTRREALRGHAAMLAFSILIAGSFSLGSRVANLVDPVAITALRFVLASVAVAVFARVAGPGLPQQIGECLVQHLAARLGCQLQHRTAQRRAL